MFGLNLHVQCLFTTIRWPVRSVAASPGDPLGQVRRARGLPGPAGCPLRRSGLADLPRWGRTSQRCREWGVQGRTKDRGPQSDVILVPPSVRGLHAPHTTSLEGPGECV